MLIGLLIAVGDVVAENVEHENILSVQYGGSWQQDQYLSPLLYTGMHVGIGNEWWQPFRQETHLGRTGRLNNWAHVGRFETRFAWTYTPVRSNVLYSLGVRGGWGAYYGWRLADNRVQIILGPYLDVDITGKLQGRYYNKPFNGDMAADVMAMTGVSWSFKGKKTSYRLRYLIRANLIGVDYMPDYWQSYYEMSKGVIGRVRCSGMWNHRSLRHELTLDLQFPHSTWRVGISHEYTEYGERKMMFSDEKVALVVGTCFRYRLRPNHDLTTF